MYTPENIKPHLELFVNMANSFAPLLGDGAKTVKDILKLLTTMMTQDWFVELVCYMLNTFDSDEPNTEQLVQSLKAFADVKGQGFIPLAMETTEKKEVSDVS